VNDTILGFVNGNSPGLLQTLSQLNSLTLKRLEQLTELQLGFAADYSNIGFNGLKSVAAVRNLEDLQDLASQQIGLASDLGNKIMGNAKQLTDLNQTFKSEVAI